MNNRLFPRAGLGAVGMVLLLLIGTASPGDAPTCSSEKPSPGELRVEQMPPEWGVGMPQIVFCTSDVDCAGCARCSDGICDLAPSGTTCMCHGECVRTGQRSCDRSPRKPLCPGLCSDSAPRRPLACGRGDDTPRLELFPGQECVVAGVVAAPDGTIAIEMPAAGEP